MKLHVRKYRLSRLGFYIPGDRLVSIGSFANTPRRVAELHYLERTRNHASAMHSQTCYSLNDSFEIRKHIDEYIPPPPSHSLSLSLFLMILSRLRLRFTAREECCSLLSSLSLPSHFVSYRSLIFMRRWNIFVFLSFFLSFRTHKENSFGQRDYARMIYVYAFRREFYKKSNVAASILNATKRQTRRAHRHYVSTLLSVRLMHRNALRFIDFPAVICILQRAREATVITTWYVPAEWKSETRLRLPIKLSGYHYRRRLLTEYTKNRIS